MRKGQKHSLETRQKIREKIIGRTLSKETRRKISEALKGNQNTKGYVGYWKGKHHSEETKRKISKALKEKKNPFYGKHRSEETKRKLSGMRKGKHNSPSTEFKKGHQNSEETKRKILEAQRKNPPSGYRGTKKHQKLVKEVAEWFDNGRHKVDVEKPIKFASRHWRIVDILVDDKFCFEIGQCPKSKKEELSNHGFEVIHLPYSVF